MCVCAPNLGSILGFISTYCANAGTRSSVWLSIGADTGWPRAGMGPESTSVESLPGNQARGRVHRCVMRHDIKNTRMHERMHERIQTHVHA